MLGKERCGSEYGVRVNAEPIQMEEARACSDAQRACEFPRCTGHLQQMPVATDVGRVG